VSFPDSWEVHASPRVGRVNPYEQSDRPKSEHRRSGNQAGFKDLTLGPAGHCCCNIPRLPDQITAHISDVTGSVWNPDCQEERGARC
jgi:hypothetical protein